LALQKGSGVGNADLIATQRLDQGQNLLPSRSKVKRAILAVAAAGLVLTAGGTVGFDAFARSRSRKRKEREQAESLEAPVSEEVSSPPKVAVVGEPADSSPQDGVPPEQTAEPPARLARAVPPDVERTAIVIQRRARVVKRPPEAAMYRSVNAQSEANGDDHDASPPATDDDSGPVPSDVRVVLQPKWIGGENGGKSR